MHILGAIAEFERGRIVERVRAGPGAGQGARQTPRPTTLRDCGRAVRGRRGPLAAGGRHGPRRQPLGRAPLAAVTQTPRNGARNRHHFLRDSGGRCVTAAVTQTVDCETLRRAGRGARPTARVRRKSSWLALSEGHLSDLLITDSSLFFEFAQ
jgi:hypothetical protein